MTRPEASELLGRPPRTLDLRLAVPAAVGWAALASCLSFDTAPLIVGVVCAAAAVAVVAAAMLLPAARRLAWFPTAAVALAVAAMLLLSAAGKTDNRQPGMLLEAAEQGRFVSASAVLTQSVHAGDARFAASLQEVRLGAERHEVAVPIVAFAQLDVAEAAIGARVELSGTLAANGPGDAAAFLLFARGAAHVVEHPGGVLATASELRRHFLALATALPGEGGGLLPGLAIGDTSAVSEQLDDAMKLSALSHLTAVSGANCAIVVGLILGLGGPLRFPRWARIGAATIALAGFVVLVTPEPSVLRAAVMAVAVLFTQLTGRGGGGVPVLAFAVIVLLAIDPWLALAYGFVLSVLATAGLLVLSRPLADWFGRFMPMPVAAVIAIPLAAQLACQPVIILLEPSIPVFGVLANLLAGPAAPLATVVGLLACLLAPWAALPAQLLAWCAWLPSTWISGVALFFAELPGNSMPWLGGPPGALLAVAVTLLGLTMLLSRSYKRRRWSRLVLAALLVIAVGAAGGEQVRRRLFLPQDWQLAQCDVGQGDAVLVRSAGKVALIDTGPDPQLLLECLDRLAIDHIDLLVLTHFDLDHVGGVPAVLGRADQVLSGPAAAGDVLLLQQLAASGAEVIEATRGQTGSLGELRWHVLWPNSGSRAPEPGNDASIALSFVGVGECAAGCLTSVHLGDLGEHAQAQLLALNRAQLTTQARLDVVKVAHHGSGDQSSRLYEVLHAQLGLIGVGAENRYGHPKSRILDTLGRVGTTVARSDLGGLVLAAPVPGGQLSVWQEREG